MQVYEHEATMKNNAFQYEGSEKGKVGWRRSKGEVQVVVMTT